MAGGWSKDGDVQAQIDANVEDAVKKARARLGDGESLQECLECGDPIPEARRQALPGVSYCIRCQQALDEQAATSRGYNRRGSKDSQLR